MALFSDDNIMKQKRSVTFKSQKRKRIIINTKKAPGAIGPYNQVSSMIFFQSYKISKKKLRKFWKQVETNLTEKKNLSEKKKLKVFFN